MDCSQVSDAKNIKHSYPHFSFVCRTFPFTVTFARERNRSLVESKRKQALKNYGCVECKACGFNFGLVYGERGNGFIECHHTEPVALLPGQKTHVDDLSLVCANCHRVIHRNKEWLTVAELRLLVQQTK